jgi:hypothetical protein
MARAQIRIILRQCTKHRSCPPAESSCSTPISTTASSACWRWPPSTPTRSRQSSGVLVVRVRAQHLRALLRTDQGGHRAHVQPHLRASSSSPRTACGMAYFFFARSIVAGEPITLFCATRLHLHRRCRQGLPRSLSLIGRVIVYMIYLCPFLLTDCSRVHSPRTARGMAYFFARSIIAGEPITLLATSPTWTTSSRAALIGEFDRPCYSIYDLSMPFLTQRLQQSPSENGT